MKTRGCPFKVIAKCLRKDPTTISKEVKAYRLSGWYHEGTFYNAKNFCVYRYHCKKTNACWKIPVCSIKCASCPRLDKDCYVCNGCDKKINHCTIAHIYKYDARFAGRKYREKLSAPRAGINLTKRELHQKNIIITSLIEQGQLPDQIAMDHPELDMSVRTMYTNLANGLFTARNINLKRKPKFKPHKSYKTQITDRSVFARRTYSDFQSLNPDVHVEMDTVHSLQESKKILLTFFFPKEKLFLAFLMNRCIKGVVRLVFDHLEKRPGTY